jgi:hypothetical protein
MIVVTVKNMSGISYSFEKDLGTFEYFSLT